jgi:hypothetical protein
MKDSLINKFIYLNIFAISLFLFGCSTTYRVRENYSKSDLYNNFNKSCYGRSIKITLTNDSSLIAHGGAIISNDSLILFPSDQNVNATYLKLDKVRKVSYKSNWLAISCGIGSGVLVGGIAGAFGATPARDKNGDFNRKISTVQGILVGGVIGSVIGLFIGYTFNYEINP